MAQNSKYIIGILKNTTFRHNVAVIFPDVVQHKEIAGLFETPAHSAGFVSINDKNVVSGYGESLSLGLRYRHGDSCILGKTLNLAFDVYINNKESE